MGKFGWDLPPGCSIRDIEAQAGPDPSPLEEKVLFLLEELGIPSAYNDRIMTIIAEYEQSLEWDGDDQRKYMELDYLDAEEQ